MKKQENHTKNKNKKQENHTKNKNKNKKQTPFFIHPK
jgi:hypothetical protein